MCLRHFTCPCGLRQNQCWREGRAAETPSFRCSDTFSLAAIAAAVGRLWQLCWIHWVPSKAEQRKTKSSFVTGLPGTVEVMLTRWQVQNGPRVFHCCREGGAVSRLHTCFPWPGLGFRVEGLSFRVYQHPLKYPLIEP